MEGSSDGKRTEKKLKFLESSYEGTNKIIIIEFVEQSQNIVLLSKIY